MRKLLSLALAVAFMAGFAISPAYAATSQTYTVLVGAEDSNRGIDIMSYFPSTLYVHVGDTVHWVLNSNEIHTVTFMAGQTTLPEIIIPAPANPVSPIMFNPVAAFPSVPAGGFYNGSFFVNSGLMGKEAGQVQEFSLTFTKTGTFDYVCLVHGVAMSAKIVVVAPDVSIPSPQQVTAMAYAQARSAIASGSNLFLKANALVKAPTKNADGSMTYYVNAMYMEGNVDLMDFFPSQLVVHPGDTVEWNFGGMNEAPHTVTFLNGADEPALVVPYPQAGGPPLLLVNPAVLFPANMGVPLTRQGYYNSGLRGPGLPLPLTYSMKIGNISGQIYYECLLHDSSGMHGSLVVVP
jgi:plastocyanin